MFPTLSTIVPGPSDVPLYLETYGDPAEEQTLFMVHGGFQSLRCFQQQFAALSEHFYIIALDLPYHGRSWPVPSSVQPDPIFWAQSIRAVLAHLQRLSSPLVIAAWSFGGLVVRNYLLTYGQEENLIGLVFIGSLFGGIDAYQYLQDEAAAQVISKLTMQSVSLPEKFAAFERFIDMLTAYPLPFMERDIQYGYNVKAFLHNLSCTDSWFQEIPCDQQQFFGTLRLPVLLIQGLEDALVPVSSTRQLALALPHSQILEYEGCGHAPFLEQPERFNRDVLQFLVTNWTCCVPVIAMIEQWHTMKTLPCPLEFLGCRLECIFVPISSAYQV